MGREAQNLQIDQTAQIDFALQRTLERIGVNLTRRLRKRLKTKNLCLAGGVVLNCLMNREIVAESGFENFFFQPVANDAGASMGAALSSYYQENEKAARHKMEHLYLGPSFSDEHVASGKIVGWFQGQMEGGPRGPSVLAVGDYLVEK